MELFQYRIYRLVAARTEFLILRVLIRNCS